MTVFKVTLKVAAPGAESAVSDSLVAVGDVCLVFVQQNVLLPFRSQSISRDLDIVCSLFQ